MKGKLSRLNLIKNNFRAILTFAILTSFFHTAAAPNKGNTNASSSCFLNAATQVMFHMKPLREYLSWAEKNNVYDLKSTPALFIKHINEMAKNESVVSPWSFRQAIAKNATEQGIKDMAQGQHDAQEFLSHIIDTLISELKTYDELTEVFKNNLKEFPDGINMSEALIIAIKKDTKKPDLNATEKIQSYILQKMNNLKSIMLWETLYLAYRDKEKKTFTETLEQLAEEQDRGKHIQSLLEKTGFEKLHKLIKEIIEFKRTAGKPFSHDEEAIKKILDKYSLDQQERDAYDIYSDLKSIIRKNAKSYSKFQDMASAIKKIDFKTLLTHFQQIMKINSKISHIFAVKYKKKTKPAQKESPLQDITDFIIPLSLIANDLNSLLQTFFSFSTIVQYPQVLVVQLKRFIENVSLEGKNKNPLSFPINLDLKSASYRLIGIVLHGGGLQYGHYWAYAKWYGGDPKWYYYNCIPSGRVIESSEKKLSALNNQTETNDDTPYLLIYEKINRENPLLEALTSLKDKLVQLAKKLLE